MTRQRRRTFLPIAVVACLAAAPVLAQGVMLAPGDEVPDLRGFDKDKTLQVVDFGKAEFTLVNFWATWCQPCKKEMPMLQAAHEKYGPNSLQVIGVTSERLADEELAEFIESLGLTYTVFRMGEEFRRAWPGVRGTLPNSVLVGKDGRLLRRYVGASEAQIAGMENDIAAVVAGRPLGDMVRSTEEGLAKGSPDKVNKN